jgi:hypothetical protein
MRCGGFKAATTLEVVALLVSEYGWFGFSEQTAR